jgi:HD-GYP domain-containing protein (c-di-GMP phosphodiesterase class II)
LAIDLGLGQPMENFLRTCLLAVRLGKVLGVGEQDLVVIYYLGLVGHLGCTAYADETAAIFGDELEASTWLITTDQGHLTGMLGAMVQHIGKGEPVLRRAQRFAHALLSAPKKTEEIFRGRCEVAQCLADRIGLGTNLRDALGQVYERWDGKGLPHQLKGEAILLPVRVVRIAQDAEILSRLRGKDGALAVLQQRAGGMYDPAIVDCCCRQADQVFQDPGDSSMWEVVLAAEPGSRSSISEAPLDEVLRAVADFVDLKSPYTLGHSSGVADLVAEAAQRCGLPDVDRGTIQRAGLLHDLGRIGVPNTIWDKPGPLTETEWERVRLHPYYTERVLARLNALGRVSSIAAQHHERLDGSGYHRGLPASLLPMTARILAAADVYHALISPRPHRAAHSAEGAADELRHQVRAGLLDDAAVKAVLVVAGHRLPSTRRTWVAGLSDREIEVLRLVARGYSNSQMATQLSLSTSTIHHHIQHIYNKLGVSTRAAAALFAMQHNLLS